MIRLSIADVRHPYYTNNIRDWQLWRDIYDGGTYFIDRYLEAFSSRENPSAYQKRKKITYNPAFAKEAVNEIKNSIFQRLVDISRKGGSDSYNKAIQGQEGGIDRLGSSMNYFIGKNILPELLPMSRVGVYVDMPEISGLTKAEDSGKQPYVYTYKTEDICSWTYDESSNNNEFSNVLLRDYYLSYDDETGLPNGEICRYRHLWLKDGKVHVQFYNDQGKKVTADGEENPEETILDIPRIPFYISDIGGSLLADVANYQIALLNLASSDMAYALNANYPFYTEQFEPRAVSEHIRVSGQTAGGQSSDGSEAKSNEIKTGNTIGRRYPVGLDRPGFIHPSAEPLTASMAKQEQLKAEIRQLVNLSVTNLLPKNSSAESKGFDQQGLESGLSYIGLELEATERKIADFWNMYERKGVATVNYPEVYKIKSESEKREEAKDLSGLLAIVPSKTYQKSICKRIAILTVSHDIEASEVEKILSEIDNAKGMTANPEVLAKHVELAILDLETASELSGYPKGTVEKAANDHAERLSRIAESQTPKAMPGQPVPGQLPNAAARGVPILDPNPNPSKSATQEKKQSLQTTTDPVVKDKQRGKGK